VAPTILDCEADSGGKGNMPADDPVSSEKAKRSIEQVHRPTLALGAARRLAEQLGHHGTGGHPAGQRLTVIAIGCHDVVVGPQLRQTSDSHRFLADIEMTESADLAHAVGFA